MNQIFSPALWAIACLALPAATVAAPGSMPIPPDDFHFEAQGGYNGHKDGRDLLQIIHPLVPASAGDHGFYEAQLKLPSGATPPYTLRFYASDNNSPPDSDGKGYMLIDHREGHRFKQVRVNGKTVWNRDTADKNRAGWIEVDITKNVTESGKLKLEAGLYEAIDSSQVNPGDLIKFPPQKAFRPKQELHETESYWGDFSLFYGGKAAPVPTRPPEWKPQVTVRPLETLPGEPWIADSIPMENIVPLGHWPFPAITGVPFPKGKFKGDAVLTAQSGAESFAVRKLSLWPDGSLKWGLVQLNARPGFQGTFKIGASGDLPKIVQPVESSIEKNIRAELKNGLVTVECLPGSELLQISGVAPAVKTASVYFQTSEEDYSVHWQRLALKEKLPERGTIKAEGEIKSASGVRYGMCRLLVTVFAEMPYVKMMLSVTNENPAETFKVKAYGLKLGVPSQEAVAQGDAWLTGKIGGQALTAAVRYFKRLGPNGLRLEKDTLDFQLFRPGDEATPFYATHPGEAKTHEIWIALGREAVTPEQARLFSLMVDAPPGLAVAPLIRASKVWGNVPRVTPESDPVLYSQVIEKEAENYFADTREGIRAFGNYKGFSSSFYWNSLHTMYALYAMTGERKWLDRAERSARHLMDLLVCHWSADKEDLGGMYAYYSTRKTAGKRVFEPDFSNADFSIRSQNPHGGFDHWELTGDSEGRDTAVGIADFLVTNPEMNQLAKTNSARHQGWVLIAVARAYAETGDPRYAAFAKEMLAAARKYIEPRRGAYIQTHSSVTHKGIVPFMAGILASGLRDYHEATGDPKALSMMKQVCDSTYEEMLDKEHYEPGNGISYYYSPNPSHRYQRIPSLSVGIIAGQAYLAVLSGDAEEARRAHEGWKAFLHYPRTTPHQVMYDLPEMLYWEKLSIATGLVH